MLYYLLLTKLIFTKSTSGLKIYTKKPWIEDNSNTTNNNKKVELTFLLVGTLSHFKVIICVKKSA